MEAKKPKYPDWCPKCVHYEDDPFYCGRCLFPISNGKPTLLKVDNSYYDIAANPETDPFKSQVGGSHYKQYKIQPYEFFYVNKIPHHKAAVIRRILRYDHPTGKGVEDLDKISHEIELIKKLWNHVITTREEMKC